MNNFSNKPILETELFNIYEFQDNQLDKNNNNQSKKETQIPGYFAVSTAPIDVDHPNPKPNIPNKNFFAVGKKGEPTDSAKNMIAKIANNLPKDQSAEIVLAIHGYNNKFTSTENWYNSIYKFINEDTNINCSNNHVFLGYRWASEGLLDGKLSLIKPLPVLPASLLFISLATCIALVIAAPYLVYWLFIILLGFFGILFSIILTLIILRIVVYFRDGYRANKFGVPDLVELLRQLDKSIFENKLIQELNNNGIEPDTLDEIGLSQKQWDSIKTEEDKLKAWNKNRDIGEDCLIKDKKRKEKERYIEDLITESKSRVKLTFIGHSMGCLVITDAIRILSDVFDPKSVGTLDRFEPGKQPSPEIGRVFTLGRLVLVAPDIPMETIMPRRANFLRSAIRRFEEAYIFSNEGDLPLRLASTIANYFSFPARTRFSGYRLGNVTVRHFGKNKKKKKFSHFPNQGYGSTPEEFVKPYGIVNRIWVDQKPSNTFTLPYEYLEFRSSDWEHKSLTEIRSLKTIASKPIANLFTYFDCTDYIDCSNKGVVTQARRKPALNLWHYVILTLTYFGVSHGGYFEGQFSKRIIYQLAFLGFKGFLKTFGDTPFVQLEKFDQSCDEKQIQVILAPERYKVDLLGWERDRSGY